MWHLLISPLLICLFFLFFYFLFPFFKYILLTTLVLTIDIVALRLFKLVAYFYVDTKDHSTKYHIKFEEVQVICFFHDKPYQLVTKNWKTQLYCSWFLKLRAGNNKRVHISFNVLIITAKQPCFIKIRFNHFETVAHVTAPRFVIFQTCDCMF